jgi:hypothetical protein
MTATETVRRDALAAVGTLVGLLGGGVATVGPDPFVRPPVVVAGVGGAIAIEAVFLRCPDRMLSVWSSPVVAVASVASVLCLGVAAVLIAPWVLGAVCWGLATYLVLLVCVLVGVGNPVAALVTARSGRT